jgi:hypothetical protein
VIIKAHRAKYMRRRRCPTTAGRSRRSPNSSALS